MINSTVKKYQTPLLLFGCLLAIWSVTLIATMDLLNVSLGSHWPVILIAFAGAVVANLTAVGGGFIFLPLFSFAYQLDPLSSLKLALSSQAFGMTSGAVGWSKSLIKWNYLTTACAGGFLGMFLGTYIWLPDNDLIHRYFGWASIFLGLGLLAESAFIKRHSNDQLTDTNRRENPLSVTFFIICTLGGLINAWVSIGIGEVVAIWLMFKERIHISQAVATGVATLAFCSIVGFIFHTTLGGVPWQFLLFTAPGCIIGGQVGARIGRHLSTKKNTAPNQPKTTSKQPSLKLIVALVIFVDGIIVLMMQ